MSLLYFSAFILLSTNYSLHKTPSDSHRLLRMKPILMIQNLLFTVVLSTCGRPCSGRCVAEVTQCRNFPWGSIQQTILTAEDDRAGKLRQLRGGEGLNKHVKDPHTLNKTTLYNKIQVNFRQRLNFFFYKILLKYITFTKQPLE